MLGLEEQRKEVDVSREKIKASILVVEGEIEEQRKEREAEAKSIDELVRCLHSPTPPRPPGNDHDATTSYPHLSPPPVALTSRAHLSPPPVAPICRPHLSRSPVALTSRAHRSPSPRRCASATSSTRA